MHSLLQGVIIGVLTAGVYALMASGQTLIFGVMKVINLAQGAAVILAAYFAWFLHQQFGIDPFLSIPLTTIAMFALGVLLELTFLRPLRHEDRAELSLLVTFGIALLIEGVLTVVWNTSYRTINTSYANSSWTVLGFRITLVRLAAFVLSVVILGALYLLLERTRFGRAVRATVQNPESAQLLGVNSRTVSAVGFGLGTATAAAAGSVYALLYPFYPGAHYDLISLLLSIVVLGGLGSIGGAIIGSVVVAVCSSVVATYSPEWSAMTFFVVLLAVLIARPQGLFGATVRGAA